MDKEWGERIIEVGGESDLWRDEFMEWVKRDVYVRFMRGVWGNGGVMKKMEKELGGGKGDLEVEDEDVGG